MRERRRRVRSSPSVGDDRDGDAPEFSRLAIRRHFRGLTVWASVPRQSPLESMATFAQALVTLSADAVAASTSSAEAFFASCASCAGSTTALGSSRTDAADDDCVAFSAGKAGTRMATSAVACEHEGQDSGNAGSWFPRLEFCEAASAVKSSAT